MSKKEKPLQVKDDINLLELMLDDNKSASPLFQPRHYWIKSAKLLSSELRAIGLHNFRRRKNSILNTFGATDNTRASVFVKSLHTESGVSFKGRILHYFLRNALKNNTLASIISYISNGFAGLSQDDLDLLCYEFAKSYGSEHGEKQINKFEGSLVGNPESVIHIGEKIYTISLLNYYIRYAYCSKRVDFNSITSMAEIGGGS